MSMKFKEKENVVDISEALERTAKTIHRNFDSIDKEKADEMVRKLQEYMEAYARIVKDPAMIDLTIRAVSLWFNIEELEKMLTTLPFASKEWIKIKKLHLSMVAEWSKLLNRMGVTYNSKYLPKKMREIVPASKMANLSKNLKKFAEKKIAAEKKMVEET